MRLIRFCLKPVGPISFERLGCSPSVRSAMFYANVNRQFEDFNKGLIDLRNFVYFASMTALFLFLAVKLLESRRWR